MRPAPRKRWARHAAAVGALGVLGCAPPAPPRWQPLPLPPLEEPGLPPLPERSPRNANYTIEARLDPQARSIEGRLTLDWRNLTRRSVSSFPFHLYWNAFRNNLSTAARGDRRRQPPEPYNSLERERRYGWIELRSAKLRLPDGGAEDLLPTLRYVQPDDGNPDDRTVAEVATAQGVGPGQSARFEIEWRARIPYGDVGRAGWVHDYHFIVQWFPKLGVLREDGWNCHQFHANTEFFSDYGSYDVRLTLPAGFVLGATGRAQGASETQPDGSVSQRFVEHDVHDFAWTASRRFLDRRARFEDPGYPPVELRLLLQPEHAGLAERYFEATRIALRSYGAWSAPYPYPQLTIVDPAWNSTSGGMEYPTLFTGGANVHSPAAAHSPEGVTIHEAGHQFWYGLVGNNEFEEAWLDEGFNSYHTAKAAWWALGPQAWSERYFGLRAGRRTRGGLLLWSPRVLLERGVDDLRDLREHGRSDVLARRGFDYRTAASYTLNSYGKPALVLQTLEGLLGDETMTRVLRHYARRQRFAHPTTADFAATLAEVTGRDWSWFFDETFHSSGLVDYAVEVKLRPRPRGEGFGDAPPGGVPPALEPPASADTEARDSEVTLLRLGEVRLPVELAVEFADGSRRHESWDGRDRWRRFRYPGLRATRAVVDPAAKLALDVDRGNNEWRAGRGAARRAAAKWSARFLFWLQNLLELHAVLG